MKILFSFFAVCLLSVSAMGTPVGAAPKPAIVLQKIVHPKQTMTDAEAAAILATMQQKGNDGEKADALKAGIKDKGITTKQLTTLLNQFNSDEAKLDCAKFAFRYTVNYKKYMDLADLFGDEASKRELEDYVGKNK